MAISIKHNFSSPKVNGTDNTLIQPSNWNDEHALTLGAGKVLGRDSSVGGNVQELAISVDSTQQSMIPPSGGTGARPAAAVAGMLRYNTSLSAFEGFMGSVWSSLAGLASANTFTEAQSVSLSSGSNRFSISSPSGSSKLVRFQTAGSSRWELGSNNASETGANNGSDFIISRYDDTGAYIDSPFSIERDTGVATLASLDIGNTDTTITRSSGGVIAIEGNVVPSPASQANGDMLYRGASSWARLAAGTSGQVLQTNGAGAAPTWVTPSATAITGVVAVANGGTGVTSSTGTGSVVLSVSPAFTGTPSLPTGATAVTQAVDTGGDLIATTGYVVGQGYLKSATASSTYLTSATASSTYLTSATASSTYLTSATASSTYLTSATASSTYAPLASPALTGTPTAPTPTAGDNDTSIATTAFVQTAVAVVAVNSLGTQTFAGPGNTFTGIPSWAKSITMTVGNMDGSSTGTDALVRIGTSAGFVSSGYVSTGTSIGATPASVTDTTGFVINIGGSVGNGMIRLSVVNGVSWICEHTIGATTKTCVGGGVVNLPGALALDRIQILPVAGTFAASGAVDVFYQ